MSRPIIAWSYSALSSFENCPRKYWATKIAKKVSDYNSDNLEGDADHQSFQYHFSKGMPLPPKLQGLKPMCDKITAAPGEKYIEYSMALNQQLVPCHFKDWDNCYVRGAGDYININGEAARYFDWKKGKFREADDQIELTSLMLFAHFPAVQRVYGGLVYYNAGRIYPHVVHRTDAPRLWNGFISRVRVLERAKQEDSWPTNPNALCGWCPYKECPFNKWDERVAAEARGEKWRWNT